MVIKTQPIKGDIPTIVLTGGSNGGKSSLKAYLEIELPKFGFLPIFLSEVATTLFAAGLNHDEFPNMQHLIFKKVVFYRQLLVEAAKSYTGPLTPVVIMDRAEMDCSVYCAPGEFAEILQAFDTTEQEIKNSYTAVIHLITTAKGKEDVFKKTFKGNKHRLKKEQDLEEARKNDTLTQEAWMGTRNLRIIGNHGSFEDKKQDALHAILGYLHAPIPQPNQRKFLVPGWFQISSISVPHQTFDVSQHYLMTTPKRQLMNYPQNADRVTERIRKVSGHGSTSYSYTLKAYVEGEKDPYILDKTIREDEYLQLMNHTIGEPIIKDRTYFFYHDQYFQLDEFTSAINEKGDMLLEVVPTDRAPHVAIPPFISEYRDVTDDPDYQNEYIAHRIAHE